METWGMIRLGASVQESANATLEELLGTQGSQRDQAEPKYRPARADIQKMRDAFDLYTEANNDIAALSELEHAADPNAETPSRKAASEWDEKYKLDGDERRLVMEYKNKFVEEAGDSQSAFLHTIEWAQLTGVLDRSLDKDEAKKLLGSALKKYDQQNWPMLYNAIQKALDDAYRRSAESYKLWPRMVQWIKDEFQRWLILDNNFFNSFQDPSALSQVNHIVDIVTEGGEILSKLRAENKIPQNFDVNKLPFHEFEQWLMDWKRENREAESQGEVIYEFHDKWTIQKLTTPEQLQFEGDEMGHCVGGYSNSVARGEDIIYSLRDPKGMPHVTMEVLGLPAYKPWGDKPLEEYGADDSEDLKHMLQGHTNEDTGEYYRPAAEVMMHNPENYDENGNEVKTGIKDEWPFEKMMLSPEDDHSEYWSRQAGPYTGNYSIGGYAHAQPLNREFEVVQVQGRANTTPKSEYQHKIKEFLDYLRSKGMNFVRSDNWYAPHDEAGEDNEYIVEYTGYHDNAGLAKSLDDWYDDHYKLQPHLYQGGEGMLDPYGMQRDPQKLYVSDWETLLTSCLGSLVEEYDQGRFRGHWQDLAQAVWHAWHVERDYRPQQQEQEVKAFENELQKADEELMKWTDQQWYYATEHNADQVAEKIQEVATKTPGLWERIKQELDKEYDEDEWDDRELLDHVQENEEGLYYEATDAIRDEEIDAYAGDAFKFLSYLNMLLGKTGLVRPQELPNPNDRHGGLPSYEDLEQMPWKSEVNRQPTGTDEIPGTFAHWRDATSFDPNEIQIYPIDQDRNVWFDEDGNQRARWRHQWVSGKSGKMEQNGELEDSFLDRQGRQGQGYVAYHGDRPVGSLTYVDDPAGWYMLGTTYVHPEYREQGIFNQMTAPLRETGKPIDAYVWNNPWLKNKVRSWQTKTASNEVMYHISPPFNRESILTNGLNWQLSHPQSLLPNNDDPENHPEGWPRGQYLFRDYEEANMDSEDDIWEVDVSGLPFLGMDNDHAVYVPEPIPPERLKLVRPGAYEGGGWWEKQTKTAEFEQPSTSEPTINWHDTSACKYEYRSAEWPDYGLPFTWDELGNAVHIGTTPVYHNDLRDLGASYGINGRYNHLTHAPVTTGYYGIGWKALDPQTQARLTQEIAERYPLQQQLQPQPAFEGQTGDWDEIFGTGAVNG